MNFKALAFSLVFALSFACSGGGAETDSRAEAGAATDAAVMAGSEQFEGDALFSEVLATSSGDLPVIAEHGVLRVLVSYSPTTYFVAKGAHHGFEAEMMDAYVKFLNEQSGRTRKPFRVTFIPLPFDRLVDALEAGQGDVIAAGMTVTPERSQRVAFAPPYLPDVSEVVVTRAGSEVAQVAALTDLAGTTVHVVRGSSYVSSLTDLNAQLDAQGLDPVQVVEVDEEIASSDLLELVNVGVIDWTVVDRHIAKAWATVLPQLVVRDELALRSGGKLAWAVRKDNPELLASLERFVAKHAKGTLMGNMLFTRYFEGKGPMTNPLDDAEQARLDELAQHFQQRAEQHGFDWLLLAAQAYRESRFDQALKSRAGAVGIMQIKPSTAADVGVKDISTAAKNIEAGTAYLAYLRDRYFSEEGISPDARVHFSLAAYNMGPAKMRKMRAQAEAQGLDPDVWFDNVEYVTRGVVGREPVDYVADIQRYYVAYKLVLRARQARAEALDAL